VCAAELGLDPRTIRRWKMEELASPREARTTAKNSATSKNASARAKAETSAAVTPKKASKETQESFAQTREAPAPAPQKPTDRHTTEEALANLPPRTPQHDDTAGGDSPVYGMLQAMALLQRNRAAQTLGQTRPGGMPTSNRNAGAELGRAMMASRTNDALAIRKRKDAWDLAQLPNAVRGTLQFLYNFVGVWGRRIMRATAPTPESVVRPR
jgi:hypothetical protein